MKKYLNFHLYLRIFLFSIFSLAFVLLAYQQIARADLADDSYSFAGWAWAPTIGWLSLNCLNDFSGDGVITDDDPIDDTCSVADGGVGYITYGLELVVQDGSKNRAVTGCAWAGNIGWWICFSDPGGTNAPTDGVYLNGPISDYYYTTLPGGLSPVNTDVENSLSHSLLSDYHASVLPLEDEVDWTWELGFPIAGSGSGNISNCFNCQASSEKRCSISDISCTDDVDCEPAGGTCEDYANNTCENCLEYEYDVNGNLSSTLAGYQCTECDLNSPEARCPDNAYNDNQNTCQTCDEYHTTPGVIVDYASTTNDGYGYMCGWAWNKQDPSGNGIGWLQFSPRITEGNNPYFQVEVGNIYSRANISNSNPLPPNKYNAYIIEAGGTITNFYASSTRPNAQTGAALPVFQNRSLIDFPTLSSTGYYQNVLGKIDYNGLVAELGETGLNKYGSSIIEDVPQFWDDVGPDQALGNSVYYNDGDLTGPTASRNIIGGSGVSGAGIVIVDGDLNITHNISYANTDVDKLSEIASLVWIVKGDVTIDLSVTEVAGTFIVLGADGGDCNPVSLHCGQFIAEAGANQLVVYGSVLARSFDLNRTYNTNGAPAEKFVNDGRLQVNPPKGMQNFVKSLPKFNYNPY